VSPPLLPVLHPDAVPWVSVRQMREVDRLMVDSGVSVLQMMENAGRHVAVVARVLLEGDVSGAAVRVLAGTGGNGGGGLAAARHLHVAGATVTVSLSGPPSEGSDTIRQLAVLRHWGVPVGMGPPEPGAHTDLVVDALLGYSQRGAPRGPVAALLAWARGRPVMSLDTPSGLELDTGTLHADVAHPVATVTLAAGKHALRAHHEAVGTLYLGDIGVPAHILEAVEAAGGRGPFGDGPLVQVATEGEHSWR
jgi:NAD(P)H-hydrate epimerase